MTGERRDALSSRSITSRAGQEAPLETPAAGLLTFWARGDETGGALTLFESVIEAGQGPPVHRHLREDEFICVLAGRLRFLLADDLVDAPAGSCVFIPRGMAHAWRAVDGEPVRFLGGFTPAAPGMERFFERCAKLPAGTRLAEGFGRFSSDAGMEVVGPPLA